MTELTDLSETDASNVTITAINIADGCAPSGINNAIRNTLGLVRRAFKSSIFRLRDDTDQTKLLAFDLSGLTTATTRTLTVPDRSGKLDVPITDAKTGAYTILAGDSGKFFRKTSTAATWSPQAAATCGDGWHVTIKVEDAALTIDPQGAETIDGAATLVIPPGTTVKLWCNGTAFLSSFIAKPRVTGLFVNDGSELTFFKSGTLTHNFASMAADESIYVDVAVAGALTTGHVAMVNSNSLDVRVALTGRIAATGILSIIAHNTTESAIDPGNATLSWAIIG